MLILTDLVYTRKFKWTMNIDEAVFLMYYVKIQVLPCKVTLVSILLSVNTKHVLSVTF